MAAAKNLGVLPYPLLEGEGKRTKDDADTERSRSRSRTTAIAEGKIL